MLGGQRYRWRAFTGGIHHRHQGLQGLQHELAKGPCFALATLSQAPRLTNQMCPAAQPARVVTVGRGFVQRLVDRADTELQSQPLGQKLLNPRSRQPEPQGQRHEQRGQPGPTRRHSLSSIPVSSGSTTPWPATARVRCPQGQGGFLIAMVPLFFRRMG